MLHVKILRTILLPANLLEKPDTDENFSKRHLQACNIYTINATFLRQ